MMHVRHAYNPADCHIDPVLLNPWTAPAVGDAKRLRSSGGSLFGSPARVRGRSRRCVTWACALLCQTGFGDVSAAVCSLCAASGTGDAGVQPDMMSFWIAAPSRRIPAKVNPFAWVPAPRKARKSGTCYNWVLGLIKVCGVEQPHAISRKRGTFAALTFQFFTFVGGSPAARRVGFEAGATGSGPDAHIECLSMSATRARPVDRPCCCATPQVPPRPAAPIAYRPLRRAGFFAAWTTDVDSPCPTCGWQRRQDPVAGEGARIRRARRRPRPVLEEGRDAESVRSDRLSAPPPRGHGANRKAWLRSPSANGLMSVSAHRADDLQACFAVERTGHGAAGNILVKIGGDASGDSACSIRWSRSGFFGAGPGAVHPPGGVAEC
jgi:hypothetical protein